MAAIFTLLVLLGGSVVTMAQREAQRVEQRTGLIAVEPSPKDLDIELGDDVWRGDQFPVFWIEPAGGSSTILPPGMERLPAPGKAVVSPALGRLASRHPALAARYPDHLVLGKEGVQSNDELLAYARMPEGRDLPGQTVAELSSGNTRAVRLRAFGSPSGEEASFSIGDPTLGPLPIGAAVTGALGFLVLPGILALALGLGAARAARSPLKKTPERVRTSGRMRIITPMLETLVLAAPGLIGAAVLWIAISPRLQRVPLVGHGVFRGDLRPPWWLFGAELAGCVVVIGFVALLEAAARSIRDKWKMPRLRPTSWQRAFTLLRVAPLVVALVAFPLRRLFPENPTAALDAGNLLLFGGLVAAITGALFIIPVTLRAVGADLGRLGSAPAGVAGRYLEHHPGHAAQPFLLPAAVLVAALASVGYIAIAHQTLAYPPPSGTPQPVFVEWLDPRPSDLDRLNDALVGGLVVPFGEEGHAHMSGATHQHGHALVVGASCPRLVGHFPGVRCHPGKPHGLPTGMEQRLTEIMASVHHSPGKEIRLGFADDVAASGSALVLDDAPLPVVEERVRTAAIPTLPAAHVTSSLSDVPTSISSGSWTVGGIKAALTVLAVACLFPLTSRLRSGWEYNIPISEASTQRLATLEAWRFAVTYYIVAAVSFFIGLAICELMLLPYIQMPWRPIGILLTIVVVMGIIGTAGAALLGATGKCEDEIA